MRNFIQPGDVITLPAPTGGIKSGEAALIGGFFGVASFDAADGAACEFQVVGVFELPATGPIAQGALAYWDGAQKLIAATGTVAVGAVTEAVASGGTIARVRLNGIAVA